MDARWRAAAVVVVAAGRGNSVRRVRTRFVERDATFLLISLTEPPTHRRRLLPLAPLTLLLLLLPPLLLLSLFIIIKKN